MIGVSGIHIEQGGGATNGLLTGLLSYWKLDEASGTIVDSHGSVDSATESVTYGATGIINNALDFESSSSNYVGFGTSDFNFERTDPFSYSYWFNPESDGVTECHIGKAEASGVFRGWSVFRLTSNVLRVTYRSTTSNAIRKDSSAILASSGIRHIVVTYDGSSDASGINIYIDGTLSSMTTQQDNLSTTMQTSGINFSIGSRNNTGNYTDGIIDEVAIWDRELDSTDVSALYNSGSGLAYGNFTS